MRNFKKAKRKLLLILTVFLTFYFQLSTFNCFSQWQATNLTRYTICFAVKGNNIFAGTFYGVYTCSNCCCNWVQKGLPDSAIAAIAFKGDTLFAGYNSCGLNMSTNNGNNWTLTSLPSSYDIFSLAIKGNNIFVGTFGFGVFLSSDGGNSWNAVNNGLPSPSGTEIDALAIKGDTIFAGIYNDGLYMSVNNGINWAASNLILTGFDLQVNTIASEGNSIFIGTFNNSFLSKNNGNSWDTLPFTNCHAFVVKGDTIFAGTYYGVYMSLNNGISWNAINTGLTDPSVYALAIKGDTLYAGTMSGVFMLDLSTILGTHEINNETKISVYPNPAINSVAINFEELGISNYKLRIYDAVDNLVLEKSLNNNKTTIDISALPSGIYFIKFETEKGEIVKRFVKE